MSTVTDPNGNPVEVLVCKRHKEPMHIVEDLGDFSGLWWWECSDCRQREEMGSLLIGLLILAIFLFTLHFTGIFKLLAGQ